MSRRAPCLTVRQPWANAIIFGPKRIENRSWPCPEGLIGRRLLIHAGARKPTDETINAVRRHWPGIGAFPPIYGAIIGSVTIVACGRVDRDKPAQPWFTDDQRPWCTHDRAAWLLADPQPFTTPIPFRGSLGIFAVPASAIESEKPCPSLFSSDPPASRSSCHETASLFSRSG